MDTSHLFDDEHNTSQVAELFYILFEYYSTHSSPMALDFIQELRVLAGLGFTACLADGGDIVCYQKYLDCFLQYDNGDFREHLGSLLFLSQIMAKMVMLAVDSLHVFCCPVYRREFFRIIKNILGNVMISASDKSEEAIELLELLQHKLQINVSEESVDLL